MSKDKKGISKSKFFKLLVHVEAGFFMIFEEEEDEECSCEDCEDCEEE